MAYNPTFTSYIRVQSPGYLAYEVLGAKVKSNFVG